MKFEKEQTKRGVFCSITEGTTMRSSRHLTSDPFDVAPYHQWATSSKEDHHEHSPVYTINNSNVSLLVTKEAELRQSGILVEPWRSDGVMKKVHFEDEMDCQRKVLLRSIVEERVSLSPMSKDDYHAHTDDHHNLISSIHTLVNKLRAKRDILPLCQEEELDKLASDQAKCMARKQMKEHSDVNDLISKISDDNAVPVRRVGENILRGKGVEVICRKLMYDPEYAADRNNISDRRFSSFGVGIAMSSKGEYYVCQLYRG